MQIPPLSHLQALIGSSTVPWKYDIDDVEVLRVQGGMLAGRVG